jgi:hypothetical protein
VKLLICGSTPHFPNYGKDAIGKINLILLETHFLYNYKEFINEGITRIKKFTNMVR